MVLGESNDVFYSIVILLNEYLSKTHTIVIMPLDGLDLCITPLPVSDFVYVYLKSIISHC